MKLVSRFVAAIASIGVIVFSFAATASAHVTVKPAEVIMSGYQIFTVNVPNEKEISTTSIKLIVPEGLAYVQPTQKIGWNIDIETEGTGDSAVVKSITWSGGEVKNGFRDEFAFSAQVPAEATEIQWKAYQTYADGTVVSWDKASSGDGHDSADENSGPFSVTKVVSETAAEASLKEIEQASVDAQNNARTALYVGAAGVVVGLVGVFLGSRRK